MASMRGKAEQNYVMNLTEFCYSQVQMRNVAIHENNNRELHSVFHARVKDVGHPSKKAVGRYPSVCLVLKYGTDVVPNLQTVVWLGLPESFVHNLALSFVHKHLCR